MAAIDRAQEAEREEVSEGAIFVERMQSDQGGQQQERRLDPLHGVVEGEPVALGIERRSRSAVTTCRSRRDRSMPWWRHRWATRTRTRGRASSAR